MMKMTNSLKRYFGDNAVYFAIVLLSSMLISGCVNIPEPEAGSQNANDESRAENIEPEKNLPERGRCANPYYPIKPESQREYRVTGDAPSSYVLSQEMESESGFTEKRVFEGGLTVNSSWSCTDDGLRNADYNNTISKSNMKFEMETLESDGITLPKNWVIGEKWDTNYKIRAKIGSKTVNGTVVIENELKGLDENVRVDGGEFTAARIDSVIKIKLDMGKMKVPASEVKMSNWFSPNVGLVKQEAVAGFGKTGLEYLGEKNLR